VSRAAKWAIAVVVALAIAVPAGTYVYINWISADAPDRLSVDTPRRHVSGDDRPARRP
jgi:hypothetical protein